MDNNQMEPSTPPRSSRTRDYPATPATPRFGAFGDLPDLPPKPVFKGLETPAKKNKKRTQNILATPRQTPRKKEKKDERIAKRAPKVTFTTNEPLHPHMDQPPPDVPGMWYVFRGKRIFRPLPPGEKPMKPVTLFKNVVEDPEEADTDVED